MWLGPRALPLSPLPVCTGTPEISFLHLLTILSKNKENGGLHARRLSVSEKNSLRRHDPHQVKGSEPQFPLSRGAAPLFSYA